jgi:tRNA(Ile)-lysidine synthase TilS/MesJ
MLTTGFIHRTIPISKDIQDRVKLSLPSNIEKIFRVERRELLLRALEEDLVSTILTAHHQDDQYETAFMRLAFGTTFAGLGGIPPENGPFGRPLLEYPKVNPSKYRTE